MSTIIYKNLLSPLGFSLEENFKAICNGKSGLQQNKIPLFSKKTYSSIVDNDKINSCFSNFGNHNNYSKLEKMSIIAIRTVLKETNINPKDKRVVLLYSTTKGNIDLIDSVTNKIPQKRMLLPQFINVLKDYFGFVNTPLIVSNACVSGTQSISIANALLDSGSFDTIIVIGGDVVSRFTLSGFSALNALSENKCRPFDKDRKGINIGECCASIVLTSKENDYKKKPKIIASSSTLDAHHITAPSREGVGLTNAIHNCLTNVSKSTIDFISAHGTATNYNDEMEALSIYNNNLEKIPMYSLKGYYGHTLGAAGILETIISLKLMETGILIPTLGYENIGVTSQVNVVTELQKKKSSCFLKTASGFGGVNTAILIQN